MKRKLVVAVITFITVCFVFTWDVASQAHSTPQMAIRTYLFLSEHPISALTTGIVVNQFQTELDRNSLELQNAKIYSLTRPPIDTSGNHLINVKVTKKGSLYYARYYGEA
ncbi:hypothetical protein DEAC_c24320 [Desulfosporosinus acididurans]|uniref:Uncharacterized protein n=1 Tax=Desulfosporosinus acididurans TaxID=476652 RepID=A0A0J1FR77_9FIRM|nr:hypothetical protein [Desulfosporosinus acididurans]KLU65802.1 hypothetical protein DEAC_c24320 [Desulfosporosinus acididurans]